MAARRWNAAVWRWVSTPAGLTAPATGADRVPGCAVIPPSLSIAPPSPAVLPVKVHPVIVTVPALSSPPPLALGLFPSAIVIADNATCSPPGTVSTGPLHDAVEQVSPAGAGGPSPSSTGWLVSRDAALIVTGAIAEVPGVLTVQFPTYLDAAAQPELVS
jgi:hypothetical protein